LSFLALFFKKKVLQKKSLYVIFYISENGYLQKNEKIGGKKNSNKAHNVETPYILGIASCKRSKNVVKL